MSAGLLVAPAELRGALGRLGVAAVRVSVAPGVELEEVILVTPWTGWLFGNSRMRVTLIGLSPKGVPSRTDALINTAYTTIHAYHAE